MGLQATLIRCFNSTDFPKIRAYFEQCHFASDPEKALVKAIEAAQHIGETYSIGLYLCTLMSDAELDLVCLLSSNTCSNRYGHEAFNFRDAAKKRVAARAIAETWKDKTQARVQKRIAQRRAILRHLWDRLQPRLKEGYELAKATIQQHAEDKAEIRIFAESDTIR